MTIGGFGGPKPGYCVYTDRISSYDLGGSAHADGRACLTSKLQGFGLPEHRSSLLGPRSDADCHSKKRPHDQST